MACAQSNVADFRQDVLLYSVVDWSSCTLQPSYVSTLYHSLDKFVQASTFAL